MFAIDWNMFVKKKMLGWLTHIQLETYGFVLSTAVTDALVLKHQVICIQSAGRIFIVLDQFHTEISQL